MILNCHAFGYCQIDDQSPKSSCHQQLFVPIPKFIHSFGLIIHRAVWFSFYQGQFFDFQLLLSSHRIYFSMIIKQLFITPCNLKLPDLEFFYQKLLITNWDMVFSALCPTRKIFIVGWTNRFKLLYLRDKNINQYMKNYNQEEQREEHQPQMKNILFQLAQAFQRYQKSIGEVQNQLQEVKNSIGGVQNQLQEVKNSVQNQLQVVKNSVQNQLQEVQNNMGEVQNQLQVVKKGQKKDEQSIGEVYSEVQAVKTSQKIYQKSIEEEVQKLFDKKLGEDGIKSMKAISAMNQYEFRLLRLEMLNEKQRAMKFRMKQFLGFGGVAILATISVLKVTKKI